MNSPILFLIFNRPDTTNLVFQEIRRAQPPRLYIAADGPRLEKNGESERCALTRAIVLENIDWDCSVHTNFKDKNIGCKLALSSAIDWFFSIEEEGIILEDDCFPHHTFFQFCDELLVKYRHEESVMHISGSNLLANSYSDMNYSYLFSRYGGIWGWATWRRAWNHYDVNMSAWGIKKNDITWLNTVCETEQEAQMRIRIFNDVYNNILNTWDYQWIFAKLLVNGISIMPKNNLIKNIGFGSDATHTSVVNELYIVDIDSINFPLIHPDSVKKDHEFDKLYSKTYFPKKKSIINRIFKKFMRVLYG